MLPKTPRIPPTSPRLTEVLVFPEVQLLDVAGPLQVFTAANELAATAGACAPYAIRVVAPEVPKWGLKHRDRIIDGEGGPRGDP